MALTASERKRRRASVVHDKVAEEIQAAMDKDNVSMGLLGDHSYQDMFNEVADTVLQVMENENRDEMGDDDVNFIVKRVPELLSQYVTKTRRFRNGDRVVVRLGGNHPWAAGAVAGVNVDENDEERPGRILPYVVKVDKPNGRLVSVFDDSDHVCRAEVCFGTRDKGLWFTIFSIPHPPHKAKRFGVGARVAVAIEAGSSLEHHTLWKHGTVTDINFCVEEDARKLVDGEWDGITGAAACVPYRVRLDDNAGNVLAHRDEHWLVRDATLQPEAIRQGKDGVRNLARMVTQLAPESTTTWQAIDHGTCKVRSSDPPDTM